MIWQRLKNMKCPTCNGFLKENSKMSGYKCNCGFFVTKEKFEAIVDKLYKKGDRSLDEYDKNLGELNNL